MADMGWTKYQEQEEGAAREACYKAATKQGHSKEQADDCDAGSLNCKQCPFGGVEA